MIKELTELEYSTSSFGLSVGTGLAIETLATATRERVDPDRKIPVVDMAKYTSLYLNVYTIVRNIFSAMSTEDKHALLAQRNAGELLTKVLQDELFLLDNLSLDMGQGLDIYLLIPDYSKILEVAESLIETDVKESQNTILFNITTKLIKKLKNTIPVKTKIDKADIGILILSNMGLDFTDNRASLLESHTGKVLTRGDLSKFYKPSGKMKPTNIPLNKHLLILIGSTSVPIGISPAIRKWIYEISIKYRWTPFTTEDKIRSNLKSNPEVNKMYKKLRNYLI